MLPCRTPSVEIHMAEALIWGFSCAVNHCQVPTEGDDRKGFYFTPCSGGRIRSGLGDICVSVIVHFNSLIASNFGSRALKFSSVWTLIWFISPNYCSFCLPRLQVPEYQIVVLYLTHVLLFFLIYLFFNFGSTAIRFSPSKRTRTSIPALKSCSQEILSSQADERNEEDRRDRLVGARSLASLDGQGTQNKSLTDQHLCQGSGGGIGRS